MVKRKNKIKGKKNRKKKKDPNAPKKPTSIFGLFYKDLYKTLSKDPSYKNDKGNAEPKKIMKEASRRWKLFDDIKKKKYKARYKKSMKQHEIDKKIYMENKSSESEDIDEESEEEEEEYDRDMVKIYKKIKLKYNETVRLIKVVLKNQKTLKRMYRKLKK
jgi:hypothetical protein